MSKLKVTTIADVTDSESTDVTNVINGSAKAWVNFNGTGTVAIRRAFNVSSITDNGTGDYTVNFTNAMSDANYCVSSEYQADYILYSGSAATRVKFLHSQATSNFRIVTGYQYVGGGSANSDSPIVCSAVFS